MYSYCSTVLCLSGASFSGNEVIIHIIIIEMKSKVPSQYVRRRGNGCSALPLCLGRHLYNTRNLKKRSHRIPNPADCEQRMHYEKEMRLFIHSLIQIGGESKPLAEPVRSSDSPLSPVPHAQNFLLSPRPTLLGSVVQGWLHPGAHHQHRQGQL